jgi:hypothetical protein
MPKRIFKYRSVGFSLIELAVVLAVSAAIGLAIWKFLPTLRGTASGDPAGAALIEAQQALDGFVVTKNRLPCPAAIGSAGDEDCTIATGVGLLPYRTLGLVGNAEAMQQIRYGVYRQPNAITPTNDADLAASVVRYFPYLPGASPAVASNGLDFCVGVGKALVFASPTALRAGNMPAAYALAHPGQNRVFDGANAAATGFTLAAQPQTESFDDRVITAGLPELFGRLNCPERLGLVNGAARSAFAAYDIDRVAGEYLKYCNFGVLAAISDVAFATLGVAMAVTNLTLVVVGGIVGLALDISTSSVSIAATVPLFVANSALAVIATGGAATSLGLASAGLTGAISQQSAAQDYKVVTTDNASAALTQAIALRRKGLVV